MHHFSRHLVCCRQYTYICKLIVGGKTVPGFGYNSSAVSSDVLIYNTEKEEWESIGDLHSPAFSQAVSVVHFNEYANYIC